MCGLLTPLNTTFSVKLLPERNFRLAGQTRFEMRKLLIPFFFLVYACFMAIRALGAGQWDATAFLIVEDSRNLQVFVGLDNPGALPASNTINLRILEKGKANVQVGINKTVLAGHEFLYAPKFNLRPAVYQIEVEVLDSLANTLLFKVLECIIPDPNEAFRFSDLFLSYSKLGNLPILSEVLRPEQDSVFFWMKVRVPDRRTLTVRAVLFRELTSETGLRSTTYSALQQVNRILYLKNREGIFPGVFSLKGLDEGRYLVEILVYEDDEILSERSVGFRVDWRERNRIFSDPTLSIEMLGLLFSDDALRLLRTDKGADVFREDLSGLFDRRFPGEGNEQMESFFKRVFEAEKRFNTVERGWDSERGRIFVRYGPPEWVENDKFGNEAWFYPKWNLRFRFNLRNP
jgi:GWxTD domain-containing protein